MATGAVQSQAENRTSQYLHLVSDHFQSIWYEIRDVRKGPVRGRSQKASRDEIIVDVFSDLRGVLVVFQFVPRQLFVQKTVIGFVRIEGPHDIVSITPHIWPNAVLILSSLGVRISCDIEPVATPAFAIVRRCKQSLDKRFIREGTRVVQEFGNVFRRWRKPDQIE